MRKPVSIILIILILTASLAGPTSASSPPQATFTAPEGFEIVSFSRHWSLPDLEALYIELKRNLTGQEIYSLQEIIIHPQADQVAAGSYVRRDKVLTLKLNLPGFLPPELNLRRKVGVINLYDGDNRRTVQAFARTLAHEYGHHFTYYHFIGTAREQEYLALRQFAQIPRVGHYHPLGFEQYLANHAWDVSELAAEDYLQLLGSPQARATATVMDIGEMLDYIIANPGASDRDLWEIQKNQTGTAGNVKPQDNFFLPLAWEVSGLEQWFLGLAGLDYPKPSGNASSPQLNYTTKTLQGRTQYLFTWTAVDHSPATLYTLVAYDEISGHRHPVRTVQGNSALTAQVGTAVGSRGNSTITWADGLVGGTKHFQVYVTFPNGHMSSSEVLSIKFSGPTQPDPRTLSNLPPNILPEPPVLEADKLTDSQGGTLTVNLSWSGSFGREGRSLERAVAISNSQEPPEIWDWQTCPLSHQITLVQPGTWYIHYYGQNNGEEIQGVLGPYTVEDNRSWFSILLDRFRKALR